MPAVPIEKEWATIGQGGVTSKPMLQQFWTIMPRVDQHYTAHEMKEARGVSAVLIEATVRASDDLQPWYREN
ncbi:unnamed protein product [Cercospora beticola]|nr:unnamed protein product [Cercospora beticola]